MSTIMDLGVLSSAGASPELCRELHEGKFEIKASRDAVEVCGSDGTRLFRVTTDGVDHSVLKEIFAKNTDLQRWVGEGRVTARAHKGNCNVLKDFSADAALLPFRGENGKVRVKIEKRHEGKKGKYEKHAAYTPFVSLNTALYRACCIAMEQLTGKKMAEKSQEFFQLAPQIRWNEKTKCHERVEETVVEKSRSDKAVYKEPHIEVVPTKGETRHHTRHSH